MGAINGIEIDHDKHLILTLNFPKGSANVAEFVPNTLLVEKATMNVLTQAENTEAVVRLVAESRKQRVKGEVSLTAQERNLKARNIGFEKDDRGRIVIRSVPNIEKAAARLLTGKSEYNRLPGVADLVEKYGTALVEAEGLKDPTCPEKVSPGCSKSKIYGTYQRRACELIQGFIDSDVIVIAGIPKSPNK